MNTAAVFFIILFILYLSFGIVMHSISVYKKNNGLLYMVWPFYFRALLYLGPATLFLTKDISWSVYTTGPIKVLIIPLLYLYFKKLISHDKALNAKDLFHFIPFIFEIVFTFPIAFNYAHVVVDPEKSSLLSILDYKWDDHFYYNLLATVARTIALIQAIYYSILINKLYKTIKSNLLNITSVISTTNLRWVKWMTYIIILNGIFSGLELFGLYSIPIFFLLAFLFLSFSAFFLFIHTILQMDINYASDELDTESQDQGTIEQDDAIKKSKKVLNKFKEQDLFLITDINLKDAAFRLNIPKYKLTEYIKVAGFENFYHFVNHLRIIKSKELLIHLPDNNSIDSVISESGFNSRSTFYRVFKENCGITPSEFLKTKQ